MDQSCFDGPNTFLLNGSRKVERVSLNALSELSVMTETARRMPQTGREEEPLRIGIMKPGQASIEVPVGYLEAMLAEIRISRAFFAYLDEQFVDFAQRGVPK